MKIAFLILLVFSEGIVVGAGIVALLTLLDIIPRLCQISNTYDYLKHYQIILILGSFIGSIFSLSNFTMNLGNYSLGFVGLICGIFVGMLASALAEAVDVIPVIERRLNIQSGLKYVLLSILFGKMFGSLINWTILNR